MKERDRGSPNWMCLLGEPFNRQIQFQHLLMNLW